MQGKGALEQVLHSNDKSCGQLAINWAWPRSDGDAPPSFLADSLASHHESEVGRSWLFHQSRAAGWALVDEDDPIESAAIWIHGLALSPRKVSQTGQGLSHSDGGQLRRRGLVGRRITVYCGGRRALASQPTLWSLR